MNNNTASVVATHVIDSQSAWVAALSNLEKPDAARAADMVRSIVVGDNRWAVKLSLLAAISTELAALVKATLDVVDCQGLATVKAEAFGGMLG